MNSPLITPLPIDADPEVESLVDFFNTTLGFCPNSVLTMQRRPEIATAFINMNKAVMENKGSVTSSLKRMIGYMASFTSGCRYCEAHTIRAAERFGAEQEKLENIWDYSTHSAFNENERAVLDFAIAASSIPNGVNNQIKENLKKYWDDGEIVEILGVISLFGFLNRWNDSMATQMEDGAVSSGETYLSKKGWTKGKH